MYCYITMANWVTNILGGLGVVMNSACRSLSQDNKAVNPHILGINSQGQNPRETEHTHAKDISRCIGQVIVSSETSCLFQGLSYCLLSLSMKIGLTVQGRCLPSFPGNSFLLSVFCEPARRGKGTPFSKRARVLQDSYHLWDSEKQYHVSEFISVDKACILLRL